MNQIIKQSNHLLLKLIVPLAIIIFSLFTWNIISRAAEKTLQETADFTAKAVEETSTSCKFVFTSSTSWDQVILHYKVNGGAQDNPMMTKNGNEWTFTLQNLNKNDSVEIFFTYLLSGVGHDSSWVTYTMGSASGSSTTENNNNNETTTSSIRIESESYTKMYGVKNEGSQISSLETNDWMRYQTNVTKAGKYRIVVRGKSNDTNGTIIFRDGSKRIASVTVNATDFADCSSDSIDLAAGSLELTAIVVAGNITADWIELQPVTNENPGNQGGTTETPGNQGGTTEDPGNQGTTEDITPPSDLTSTDIPVADTSIPQQPNKMIFQFNNLTNGKYSDDQIYWCILGIDPSTGKFCYVDAQGNKHPLTAALNTIQAGDRMCADICNTVSENKYVYMPSIISGRMYISYGEQVYITVNEDAAGNVGFAGPDMNNPSDPNSDIYFEFLEFTIGTATEPTHYWGNTTRVDNFCFPIVTRLIGETNGVAYDKTVGDVGSRAYIFNEFKNTVPDAFKTLTDEYRIYAPCKKTFNEGQPYGDYYQSTINAFWDKYSKETLKFTCQAGDFEAYVSLDDNRIHFTDLRSGLTGVVDKPTTQDVLEGKGAFDRFSGIGDAILNRDKELAFEAQLCAAFNRGLALNPELWYTINEYYPEGSVCNYYSKFWHEHSVNGYAYGFCYDDVNDQSTLLECNEAKQLVIDLKW